MMVQIKHHGKNGYHLQKKINNNERLYQKFTARFIGYNFA